MSISRGGNLFERHAQSQLPAGRKGTVHSVPSLVLKGRLIVNQLYIVRSIDPSGRVARSPGVETPGYSRSSLRDRRQARSPNVTPTSCATLGFAGGLAVRAEVFLRLAAPEDAGGKLVLFLAVTLVVHLLAAQLAAGTFELRGIFGSVHKLFEILDLCVVGENGFRNRDQLRTNRVEIILG